ncbi:dihydroorotate oxidase A [Cyclobacterium xiamenense]|uniref:Dihydroorotate dehydrogenase (quinone) n=1 Tax=Cyclobacterium xiamenense TaxID=1297121 RepID=A0A1H6XIZ1_9BACT|nr:quinone-dependent dihydroorotate dehydrogenase [Cyclobacterium xiamenense]SEJ29068.1 dihydroorotate oxidase A [Cyclobacterium xiamenense]
MYKYSIKPFLFLKDPESAHHFTFSWIKRLFNLPILQPLIKSVFAYEHQALERTVFGLTFRNPIGLAAGFDKDASLIDEMSLLGFGFIEIGTLTPRPQAGNPKPRLFRLPQDQALINRMGFNNGGVAAAVERLKKRKSRVLIGGNIGKNKDTPNEEALDDYLYCLHALHPYVDYFVVNVSSPNTPDLRRLQDKEPLEKLLTAIKKAMDRYPKARPVLLKIAPDLTNGQLDDIIAIVTGTGIDGVVATNTTIDRGGLKTSAEKVGEMGAGGLSGKVLSDRSTEVIRYLTSKSGNAFPVIGVGGIFTDADVQEKLEAGASLVQVYTGMIYEGPALVKRLKKGLSKRLTE